MCVKVCRRVTRNHPLMPLRFHTAETLAPHAATEPWEFSVTPLGTVSNSASWCRVDQGFVTSGACIRHIVS
jgi:hypothetical protein